MLKKYSLQTQGVLLGLFAMLTFSINDGAFKFAMQLTEMSTAIFTGSVFSLVSLAVYAIFHKISLRPQKWRNGLLYALFFFFEQIAFIYALKYIPIAELFVIVLAAPVCVLLLSSVFLKEHLARREVMALLFGLTGALVVVGAPVLTHTNMTQSTTTVPLLAWGLAFANIFLNAAKVIFLRKHCKDENSLSLATLSIFVLCVFFGLQIDWLNFSIPTSASAFLLVGGILSALGAVYYIQAFQLAKAALVSATQYSQIIWAVLMGVFLFKETLTAAAICGSLLIITSGYFLYLKKSENGLDQPHQ